MSLLEEDACPIPTTAAQEMEQRRNPRYACIDGGVLRLAVRPEFRGRRALLVDVSTGGIGFLLEETLPEGTVLVFELQQPGGAAAISRIARVRHARPHLAPADAPWNDKPQSLSKFFREFFRIPKPKPPCQAWFVGCQFDRPLAENEVKQLLDQLKPNGAGQELD